MRIQPGGGHKVKNGETADSISKLISAKSGGNGCSESEFAEVAAAENGDTQSRVMFVEKQVSDIVKKLQSSNRHSQDLPLEKLPRTNVDRAFENDTFYRLSSITGVIDIEDEHTGELKEKYARLSSLTKDGKVTSCVSYASHGDKAYNPEGGNAPEAIDFFKYNAFGLNLPRKIIRTKDNETSFLEEINFSLGVIRHENDNGQNQLQVISKNSSTDEFEPFDILSILKGEPQSMGTYNTTNSRKTSDDIEEHSSAQLLLHRISNSGDVVIHLKSRSIHDSDNLIVVNEFILIYKKGEKKKDEKKEGKEKGTK